VDLSTDFLPTGEGHPKPRIRAAVIVAHPDDEVIGAGVTLTRHRPKCLVHVTDGAPLDGQDASTNGLPSRTGYAATRRAELRRAMELCGLESTPAHTLGCVDQQASLAMPFLAHRVAALIRQQGIDCVFTHAYEGGHPDHDATAFATHAACALLEAEGFTKPALIEMTGYHMGPNGIETSTFLPVVEPHHGGGAEIEIWLDAAQQAFKQRLFDCFGTQRQILSHFALDIERFRLAPDYVFGHAPHQGKLFYEHFNWGMTASRFHELATAAVEELGIGAHA
jgi:LmbE family N-acetylglucosaminyl deacetylase